ncbi:MAG: hypothetical protein R3253_10130 [Longimicrobiales bacterium]|nr:hypothetical protein [Longimicrobiales bacterium]
MFQRRVAGFALRAFIATLLFSPAPVAAQQPAIEPGEEVRVRWRYDASTFAHSISQVTVAEVVDVTPNAILLRRGNRHFTVPMANVRSLERRVGTRPASAPRMVIGSALGFLGGMAFGVLRGEADSNIESSADYGLSMGVLIGAPVGALIAYATSRERGIYERVGLPALVSGWTVDTDGRVGLSFRLPSG